MTVYFGLKCFLMPIEFIYKEHKLRLSG